MSYWSHNPEVYDEILAKELLQRQEKAPGECLINFNGIFSPDWGWLADKFGEDFAHSIATEAERNYWSGLCP